MSEHINMANAHKGATTSGGGGWSNVPPKRIGQQTGSAAPKDTGVRNVPAPPAPPKR